MKRVLSVVKTRLKCVLRGSAPPAPVAIKKAIKSLGRLLGVEITRLKAESRASGNPPTPPTVPYTERVEYDASSTCGLSHFGGMSRIARRLLPVIERELKLVVYRNQNTCWHYDDKIAQAYLLEAAGIPVPKTWVWFERASRVTRVNVGVP
jgi:hypothetical protein